MNPFQVEQTIYRIINGEYTFSFNNLTYIAKQPSLTLNYQAQYLYADVINKNRFQPWINKQQCRHKLILAKVLSGNYQVELDSLNKTLDGHKLELYVNVNPSQQKQIRKYIELTKDKLNELQEKIYSLDYMTLEGYADICKQEFLLLNTIYHNQDLVFKLDTGFSLLNRILDIIVKSQIKIKDYRFLARSNIWRGYWRSTKDYQPFPLFPYFTEEQLYLISFSQMYDSVYESPECPSNEVINDDDMLDGWFIKQNKDIEETKKQSRSATLAEKHGNAQEIYVVARSEEDKQQIDKLNTMNSQIIKKQRQAVIKQKGQAVDGQFMDKQLEQRALAHQAYMQKIRRG